MTRNLGFTFVEVLMAMSAGLVVLGAVVAILVLEQKTYDVQEQTAEMVQTARAAMDMLSREVRMAGFDPTGAGFDGLSYHATQLRIATDFRGAKADDPPDGDTNDPNERITYCYDAKNLQIDRNTGGGNQPFAENIQGFTFNYLDSNGNATTNTTDIRQVRITITARTARPDPYYSANQGYRTYTLISLITPMNLACR